MAHEHRFPDGTKAAAGRLREVADAYRGGEDRPVGSFVATLGVYGGFVAALTGIGRLRGARLPERVDARDLALLSVATFRLARTIAKDPVTSPLRAPFTRFAGTSGEAELAEQVRGSGARHAVGELVTCPFCLAQWVSTALAAGLVIAPRQTRLAAGVLAVVATADALQFAYDALQTAVTGG